MKIRQVQDSRNQHIVAIELNGELRSFFTDSSLHTCGAVINTLRRDIARHGESVLEFSSLPLIAVRKAKSGRKVFDTLPLTPSSTPSGD